VEGKNKSEIELVATGSIGKGKGVKKKSRRNPSTIRTFHGGVILKGTEKEKEGGNLSNRK